MEKIDNNKDNKDNKDIKKNEGKINRSESSRRTEIFGVERRPSYVISRQTQEFYDFYTRRKFRGLSKYELFSKMFKIAQKKDDVGYIAQFALQVERESIAADDFIVATIDKAFSEDEIEDEENEEASKVEKEDLNKERKKVEKNKEHIKENTELINELREEIKELKKTIKELSKEQKNIDTRLKNKAKKQN